VTHKLIEENTLNTLYLFFYGTLKSCSSVDNLGTFGLAASHLSPEAVARIITI
jgi:hypothetical protein